MNNHEQNAVSADENVSCALLLIYVNSANLMGTSLYYILL